MRALIVISVAVIYAGVGLAGDVIFWQGPPRAPVLAVAGLLVGLLLGLLLARVAYPSRRPRRRVDLQERPNQVVRRVDR
jgi:membrane associated rhomboid family serine protease